jgi:hypothetical protein
VSEEDMQEQKSTEKQSDSQKRRMNSIVFGSAEAQDTA